MRRIHGLGAAALAVAVIAIALVQPASGARAAVRGVVTGKTAPCGVNYPTTRLNVFQGKVRVATGQFRVGRPFRFALPPGRYSITHFVDPSFGTGFAVKTGRTTTVVVKDVC
jgi:hypothetical protein